MDWLLANKEWLFGGIGATVLGLVASAITAIYKGRKSGKDASASTQQQAEVRSSGGKAETSNAPATNVQGVVSGGDTIVNVGNQAPRENLIQRASMQDIERFDPKHWELMSAVGRDDVYKCESMAAKHRYRTGILFKMSLVIVLVALIYLLVYALI